jgi:hypothetical protein
LGFAKLLVGKKKKAFAPLSSSKQKTSNNPNQASENKLFRIATRLMLPILRDLVKAIYLCTEFESAKRKSYFRPWTVTDFTVHNFAIC